MNGELIYEYELDLTEMVDFGISLPAILSGEATIPPQGARIDAGFDGRSNGRLSGRVHGIDHLFVRADGRFELNIRAIIETDDGHRIAMFADGVAVPRANEPIADLSENVTLTTAAVSYSWVCARQIWATGTVNFVTGKINIAGYMQ